MKKNGSLKILQIAYSASLAGGEFVLYSLAENLKNDHEVHVLCPNEGQLSKKIKTLGVPVFFIPMSKTFDLISLYKMIKLMKKEQYDLIHSHGMLVNILSRIAGFVSKIPVIFSTTHLTRRLGSFERAESYKDKLMEYYYSFLDNTTSLLCTKCIAVSDSVKNDLIFQGYSPSQIKVIKNGIDISKLESLPAKKELRKKLGFSDDCILIGNVSRLSRQKAVHDFIKAISILVNDPLIKHKDIKVLIIGDGPEKNSLIKLSKELNIEHIIHFTGFIDNVTEYMKSLDILALSSLWEGLPLVILEAMALSLPICATSADGTAEVIEHKRNGLLSSPHDYKKLAENLLYSVNNLDEVRNFGIQAYHKVKNFHTINRVIKDHLTIYQKHINSSL